MHLDKGHYTVTWTRYELGTVGGPLANSIYECPPARKLGHGPQPT